MGAARSADPPPAAGRRALSRGECCYRIAPLGDRPGECVHRSIKHRRCDVALGVKEVVLENQLLHCAKLLADVAAL